MIESSKRPSLARRPGNLGEPTPASERASDGLKVFARVCGFCIGAILSPVLVLLLASTGLFGFDEVLDAWVDLYPAGMPPDDPHAKAIRFRENALTWLLFGSVIVGGVVCCLFAIRLTRARRPR